MPDEGSDEHKIPIPINSIGEKIEALSSSELSETHRFIISGIEDAQKLASKAHEQSSQSMSLIEVLSKNIEDRDRTIKREFDQLREDIKLNNSQHSDAIRGFTNELRSFNSSLGDLTVSLAKMESVKEASARMETELAGQGGRLTAHIESQSRKNATLDTQLKNLDNSTDRDYKRLEDSILKLTDEFRTALKENKAEIKTAVGDNKQDLKEIENISKPAVELFKFLKWFVYLVVGLGACLWTYIQIADRLIGNKDNPKPPNISQPTTVPDTKTKSGKKP